MKLLFVHGTKVKEDANGMYYTGGSYSEEIWNRYLSLSTEFSIIARKDPFVYDVEFSKKRFNYFDKEKINFIEVPDLNSSIKSFFNIHKRKKINEIIKNAVFKSHFLIARVPSYNGYIAVKFAREFNKPYLVEVVGCSWDALWNYSVKGKLLAPISYLRQKKVVRNAPYAIYVTNGFLQNRYPTTGSSVNCSNVALKNRDEGVLEKRIKKIMNIHSGSKLVIGTTAAVDVRYKGQQCVIKALGKLKKQNLSNFEYQLVGRGNHSYLKSVAEQYDVTEQVKFLGTMPHQEIFNWLDKIDIYVQPSKTEGLPRALIEAMSRGLLAIGTNAGGIPELLEQKYIVSKSRNNVGEISNILKKIDKDELILQAERNHRVSKEYDKSLIESRRQLFLTRFILENSSIKMTIKR